jgi:dihydroneopterin aldolase/2-amino-4-hydroxy-6-hydroxymethyldihydropteridine pyrophosphokinase
MDEIKVTGIEFFAYHGVLESEKKQGQIFKVDCAFTLDTSVCEDDLSKTVNYGDLTCQIVAFCQKNRYDLIETLANELARFLLLQFPIIKELTITVHKPHAPIPTNFSDVELSITRGWKTCYLAIGSNLGDRKANLDLVSLEIAKDANLLEVAKSAYIETEPYGVLDQPKFLNGAIKLKTVYTPFQLLAFCQKLEAVAGRLKTRHWGERTLDIDILFYSDEVIFTPELIIPHPELHLRAFVLMPLCEIEPYLIHPIQKMDVKTMLKELNQNEI